MNRDGHNNVKFFIGPEVEMTPAHGKKTLFVVGEQSVEEIIQHAKNDGAMHVFLGANHSFDSSVVIESWVSMIEGLLNAGYMVTLDYSVEFHKYLLDNLPESVWKSRNFIPLVSVRIPNIENSGPNLTVKIDDIDFAATNPGVWCMHYSELIDSNRFTGWSDYDSDRVIRDSTTEKSDDEFQVEVNKVTLEINETVSVNLNDLGLDVSGTTAMEEKAEATDVTETVEIDPVVETAETQPTVELETVSEKPEEVKETKKKAGKKE